MNGNGLRPYLLRFFTQWVAEDPDPAPSNLDRLDWTMGDIGEDQREYELEPITTPVVLPVETPSTPAPQKEPVPA